MRIFLYLSSLFSGQILCYLFSQLELGYNPIGPDGAKALCEVLKFHGKIETLKLGWCQVTCAFKALSLYSSFSSTLLPGLYCR